MRNTWKPFLFHVKSRNQYYKLEAQRELIQISRAFGIINTHLLEDSKMAKLDLNLA